MKFIKNIIAVAIGLVVVLGLYYFSGSGVKLEEFKPYRSDEGRFSILLPDEPEREIQKVDAPIGTLEFIIYQAGSERMGCVVGYVDYPQKMFENVDIKKMLDGARNGVVEKVNGKLKYEKVLDFHGNTAREFEIKVPEKATIKARVILIGNRLYHLMAVSASKKVLDKNCPKYFDSFKVDGLE